MIDMTETFVQVLDTIADRLEARGLLKEASSLDVISNTIEETVLRPSSKRSVIKQAYRTPQVGSPVNQEPKGLSNDEVIKILDRYGITVLGDIQRDSRGLIKFKIRNKDGRHVDKKDVDRAFKALINESPSYSKYWFDVYNTIADVSLILHN